MPTKMRKLKAQVRKTMIEHRHTPVKNFTHMYYPTIIEGINPNHAYLECRYCNMSGYIHILNIHTTTENIDFIYGDALKYTCPAKAFERKK